MKEGLNKKQGVDILPQDVWRLLRQLQEARHLVLEERMVFIQSLIDSLAF